VIIELGYRLGLVVTNKLHLDWLTIADTTLRHMKEDLSPFRLLHFLSVALLVATYVKKDNPMLNWPGASVLIKSGRSSLQVFCLGAILTVLLNLFVAVEQPIAIQRLALDFAAIGLLGLTATLLMRSRIERRQAQVTGRRSSTLRRRACCRSEETRPPISAARAKARLRHRAKDQSAAGVRPPTASSAWQAPLWPR
jgi:hypothetical protein